MVRSMEAGEEGNWRKAFEDEGGADWLPTPRESVRCHGSRNGRGRHRPDGAALHDIISVIQRRNAGVEIIVDARCGCRVEQPRIRSAGA